MSAYPKKLDNNPIEESGLPNKSIHSLQFWNNKCYVGYGDYNDNTGPTWILKHQPSPCQFLIEGLANDEGIYDYLVLNNGESNNLYFPGSDSREQRAPCVAANSRYSLISDRDSFTGELTVGVLDSIQLLDGNTTEVVENVYIAEELGAKTSDLAIAINKSDSPEQCLGFHTMNGLLYYRFGAINSNCTITWQEARQLTIQEEPVRCETLSVSVNAHNQLVVVYRFFYRLYMIYISDFTWGSEFESTKIRMRDLGIETNSASVAINDLSHALVAYGHDEKIKTRRYKILGKDIPDDYESFNEVAGSAHPAMITANNDFAILCVQKEKNIGDIDHDGEDEKINVLHRYKYQISSKDYKWSKSIEYLEEADSPAVCLYEEEAMCFEAHKGDEKLHYMAADFGRDCISGQPSDYKSVTSEWKATNFYKRDDRNGIWIKYRTIPGNHTFDLCFFGNTLFASIGQTNMGCLVKYTKNPTSNDDEFGKYYKNWLRAIKSDKTWNIWARHLFQLGEKLYAIGDRYESKKNVKQPERTYEYTSDGFIELITEDTSAPNDYDALKFSETPKKFLHILSSITLFISDDNKLYKLKDDNGTFSRTEISVDGDHGVYDLVLLDKYVYALIKKDGYPRIYRADKHKLTEWTLYGSKKDQWKDHHYKKDNVPCALAVRESIDMYVGCEDGSIWIDVPCED